MSAGTIGKRAKLVQAALDDADIPWHRYLHSAERRRILNVKRKIAEYHRDRPGR